MQAAALNDIVVHWREDGDPSGVPVVFANSLGTDLRVWDAVLPHLPDGYRIIRYDKRGHGLTTATPAPYAMQTLVDDAAALLDHLNVTGAVIVGLSIGGMIAQGLADQRPDLVSGVVLSNSASRMGTTDMWNKRIAAIKAGGLDAVADDIMERWFAPRFRQSTQSQPWRQMLTRTPADGYLGCCHALSQADFTQQTATLRTRVLAVSGELDGACSPETVARTAALVPNSRVVEMADIGHLPCVEAPAAFGAILSSFLEDATDDIDV